MQQLFYISRSLIAPQDLRALCAQSQRHNHLAGLTGVLMFTGGTFAQVLEGPANALAPLMARIQADPRHCQVRRLLERPITQRRFGQWSMQLVEAPGADDLVQALLETPEVPRERAERLLELLAAELAVAC